MNAVPNPFGISLCPRLRNTGQRTDTECLRNGRDNHEKSQGISVASVKKRRNFTRCNGFPGKLTRVHAEERSRIRHHNVADPSLKKHSVNKRREVDGKRTDGYRDGCADKAGSRCTQREGPGRPAEHFLRDSVAVPFMIRKQEQEPEHSPEGYAENRSGSRERQGSQFGVILTGHFYAVHRTGLGIFLQTGIDNQARGRQAENQAAERFDHFGNRGGVHVAQAFVIAAVNGHHAGKKHRRGNGVNSRKGTGRIAAQHKIHIRLCADHHNGQRQDSQKQEDADGSPVNLPDIAVPAAGVVFRNQAGNGNGKPRCRQAEQRVVNGIGICKIAVAHRCKDIGKRYFVKGADNFCYGDGNHHNQGTVQKALTPHAGVLTFSHRIHIRSNIHRKPH